MARAMPEPTPASLSRTCPNCGQEGHDGDERWCIRRGSRLGPRKDVPRACHAASRLLACASLRVSNLVSFVGVRIPAGIVDDHSPVARDRLAPPDIVTALPNNGANRLRCTNA